MNYRLFFIFTPAYFLLPMLNISFAYAAVICMLLPFVLLRITGKKTWCAGICPRANLFSLLKVVNIGFKAPRWLTGKKMRRNLLIYFGINLFFIAMSTLMVTLGRVAPIDKIRILIAFQLPFGLPQLFPSAAIPAPALHLAYRFYSLMLTSTILGLILAVLFKPRTWCAICPVNTISTNLLKRAKTEVSYERAG